MASLPQSFFNRKAQKVAEDLLGCYLVRKTGKKEEKYMIVETEAYDGFDDRASHAWRGKTKRNEIMFGHPGFWYVYFVYGVHWMLNVVTGEKDYPSAVLIRGVAEAKGPGKLTKLLKIDRDFNTKKLGGDLWIEKRDMEIKKKDIQRTPRIGVAYAGPIWSQKKYRF
ncbi:MAG TPA: DNA-3-methyladenine glycosylase, partial [Candidatus Paceibacterota bacterium]|nr:DNA-3-methyladenine glycosylase [Candidatus Paceibacterota bacterium]